MPSLAGRLPEAKIDQGDERRDPHHVNAKGVGGLIQRNRRAQQDGEEAEKEAADVEPDVALHCFASSTSGNLAVPSGGSGISLRVGVAIVTYER